MPTTRPNLKRPGYTATGRQWKTIGALRADGWVILDRGEADLSALAVKRAANLLFNLSQRETLTADELAQMRAAVAPLDDVIRALGANPYSPAWSRFDGQEGSASEPSLSGSALPDRQSQGTPDRYGAEGAVS